MNWEPIIGQWMTCNDSESKRRYQGGTILGPGTVPGTYVVLWKDGSGAKDVMPLSALSPFSFDPPRTSEVPTPSDVLDKARDDMDWGLRNWKEGFAEGYGQGFDAGRDYQNEEDRG